MLWYQYNLDIIKYTCKYNVDMIKYMCKYNLDMIKYTCKYSILKQFKKKSIYKIYAHIIKK